MLFKPFGDEVVVLNSGAKLQQKPQTAVTQFAAKIALIQENGEYASLASLFAIIMPIFSFSFIFLFWYFFLVASLFFSAPFHSSVFCARYLR